MTISLGGAPGPQTGGLTQIGARPCRSRPRRKHRRNPPITPPAPTPPKMTLPDPAVEAAAHSRNRQQAPPEAAARNARTRARSQPRAMRVPKRPSFVGRGLGSSSAGGVGGPVQVDVANFCCPDYLAQLVTFIQRSWDQNQGVVGSTTMKFTICTRRNDSGAAGRETERVHRARQLSDARRADYAVAAAARRVSKSDSDRSHAIRLSTVIMKNNLRTPVERLRLESWQLGALSWSVAVMAAAVVIAAPQQPAPRHQHLRHRRRRHSNSHLKWPS